MKTGIYAIINTCNNKIYIGQSKNIKNRINRHKSELKHNKHRNLYLQREFNKYGAQCFSFKVLEFCDADKLNEAEGRYIKLYNSTDYNNGFNATYGGENTQWTDEARKKRSGNGNPMFGKKLSKEHLEAVRIANLGTSDKLIPDDVVDIKQKLLNGIDAHLLARQYNVSYSTIHKIYRVKNWYWIAEDLNEKLIQHQKKEQTERRAAIKERNANIKKDFQKGLSRKEIQEKYCVSRHVVHDVLLSYHANTEVKHIVKDVAHRNA